MTEFWLDNQLSPAIARWMQDRFEDVVARPVRDIGLRDATDRSIFEAAFAARAVIVTKDADFERLTTELAEGPQVVWLTCGNTSNERLRAILEVVFPRIQVELTRGVRIVEVKDETSLA